jgi:hypothetical protein
MKTVVISYSMTGNNEALAKQLSEALGADHLRIVARKPRTMASAVLDLIFRRKPPVEPLSEDVGLYELAIFVGPVWAGQVASPFRACFDAVAPRIRSYAFVSISGGAVGPNPRLAGELKARLSKEAAAVVDLHIADLLPQDPPPKAKDTSAYRLDEAGAKALADSAIAALREAKAIA